MAPGNNHPSLFLFNESYESAVYFVWCVYFLRRCFTSRWSFQSSFGHKKGGKLEIFPIPLFYFDLFSMFCWLASICHSPFLFPPFKVWVFLTLGFFHVESGFRPTTLRNRSESASVKKQGRIHGWAVACDWAETVMPESHKKGINQTLLRTNGPTDGPMKQIIESRARD